MKYRVHTYSNKGGRERNEDSIDTHTGADTGVYVLADGLGGHRNGEAASGFAAEFLVRSARELRGPDANGLREAFLATNVRLLEMQKEPGCKGMKTTAVALCLCGDQAMWGHVGDSRLYYFTDGVIGAVTKDQSVTYRKYATGEISYADMRTDEDRSSLLGVLGNGEKCTPDVLEAPRTVKAGDAFLLCSDGFWEYVQDEEMLLDLLKAETPKEWTDYMLLRLIRRVKPSYDNLSAIAVLVE